MDINGTLVVVIYRVGEYANEQEEKFRLKNNQPSKGVTV